jgi:hypothetical protein
MALQVLMTQDLVLPHKIRTLNSTEKEETPPQKLQYARHKINISLPTLSTLDVDVEQREPSHTETSLSNEAGARDENENSSVGSNSKIDENTADHVAINVHPDDDSSHKRRSTEAEAPVDLEAIPDLDSPLPLQMIQSQAEDTFLAREKV